MSLQPLAPAIACNRFGLGARPGELAGAATDPRGWLRAQLRGGPPLLGSAQLPAAAPALQGSEAILAGEYPIVRSLRELRQQARPAKADQSAAALAQPFMRLPQYLRPIYLREVRARAYLAATTPRPFVERLVQFWSNHFAVSVDKVAVLGLAGSLEREAIRPHVLGRFEDLLLAVEQHPAMLLYLDNQQSIGPDSLMAERAAARGRHVGLNENLGREILELHTLGVDSGYTQRDVTTFARVLTGWSVGVQSNLFGEVPGRFRFRPAIHEPGPEMLLGRRYAQAGQAQGEAVLRDLAHSSATARHIATKLARHFVADDPPPATVARLSEAFERSHGYLPAVYEALIDSREPWEQCFAKFRSPQDYLYASLRALGAPPELVNEQNMRIPGTLTLLGQRAFAPGSPAGWPDGSDDWNGAGALLQRIEFADALGQRVGAQINAATLAPSLWGAALSDATHRLLAQAASPAQALTLLLTAPEFMRR